MKKRNNYYKNKKVNEITDLDYNDYVDMFEEGHSDVEISQEFGISESFVKRIREEYQQDY